MKLSNPCKYSQRTYKGPYWTGLDYGYKDFWNLTYSTTVYIEVCSIYLDFNTNGIGNNKDKETKWTYQEIVTNYQTDSI